jgi:hypothetical protein
MVVLLLALKRLQHSWPLLARLPALVQQLVAMWCWCGGAAPNRRAPSVLALQFTLDVIVDAVRRWLLLWW